MPADAGEERTFDLAACCVRLVEDTALGVAAFAGQVVFAFTGLAGWIEFNAVFAQGCDRCRAAFDPGFPAGGVFAGLGGTARAAPVPFLESGAPVPSTA